MDKNGKWGYVDCKTGDLIIECKWDKAEDLDQFNNDRLLRSCLSLDQ